MRRLIALILLITVTGCGTFTPQLGFKEVNDSVSSRTGNYLYWNTGTLKDNKVQQEILKLLSSKLNADSATQIALLNNKGLQAVYQRLGVSQADLIEAGLFPNPILNGEIRFPIDGPNLELSVVQSFVKIFEIPLRKKIATSQFEEAKIEVIERALLLAYQTRKTFYEYLSAEQLLEMANTALLALEASKELATKLHQAGNITDLDLAQEQSNYEALRIEVIAYEEELISAREQLNALLGLEDQQINWKAGPRLPEISALNLKDAEKNIIINNLTLSRTRQRLMTLSASLDVAETFRVFGETEVGVSGVNESDNKWGFGPAFTLPIPFFNQGTPQIHRVNSQLKHQHDLSLDMQIKINAHSRALLSRIKLVESRLQRYKNVLLPLQARLVAETQKQYNAMLIDAFQLLGAKRKQIEIGKDYILALKSYWLLRTELETMISGILPAMVEDEENKL